MFVSNSTPVRNAPVGVLSLYALATVALFSILFRFSLPPVRWVAAFFIVVAYLLFAPAVAGALYSLLFEPPKAFSLAALILAGVAVLTMLILLDGLLLLPFWFLGIMGIVKFVKWRTTKKLSEVGD
jgi:hypothetical protein